MSSSKTQKNLKREYQMLQTSGAGSAEEMKNRNIEVTEQDDKKKQEPSTLQKHGGKAASIGGISGLLFYVIVKSITAQAIYDNQYRFMKYCPVTNLTVPTFAQYKIDLENKEIPQEKYSQEVRFLTSEIIQNTGWNDTVQKYIIFVQQHQTNVSDPQSAKLMYCSWVTDWGSKDCSKARPICTMPGPIFYVQRNHPIDVAWVYNIKKPKNYNMSTDSIRGFGCYAQNPPKEHCNIQRKLKNNCTHLDPTKQSPSYIDNQNMNINQQSIPMSVHIHGLEVRPVFDGHPLSWLGPNGQVGTGFQSLILNEGYFNSFRDTIQTQFIPNTTDSSNLSNYYFKLNRYQNFQPPGNLWYHDHAMHVTYPNVLMGLAGDYIIYDPKVQQDLPNDKYQIFIVAGQNFINQTGNTTIYQQNKTQENKTKQEKKSTKESKTTDHGGRTNPKDVAFTTEANLVFERNQTYRIRILNGQFDSTFTNLKFVTECKQINKGYVKKDDCKTINFTVIGTDSSLFNATVTNVSSINLASAQRYQILIIFDGVNATGYTQNPISSTEKYVYLVNDDSSVKTTDVNYIRLKYPLADSRSTNRHKSPFQTTKLNVEYYNLSNIQRECNVNQMSTQCISVKRMRPLFRRGKFFFNGHYSFSGSGASDNPRIGTTQDWYFINTMGGITHPIHVHLINFQIVNKTTLSFIEVSTNPQDPTSKDVYKCSFYEMDYYIEAGYFNKSLGYQKICFDMNKNNLTIEDPKFSKLLKNFYNEDSITNSTSGFDIYAEKVTDEDWQIYTTNKCQVDNQTQNKYKYICASFSNEKIPQHYRRWKEVVYLDPFDVFQVRIRWTSTQYNTPAMPDPYPYFNVPEDQLIQFPGYVYHCHFLHHQDDELMRSIMMQPSDQFEKHYRIEDLPDSKFKQCMTGKNNSEGWKARYECINQQVGC